MTQKPKKIKTDKRNKKQNGKDKKIEVKRRKEREQKKNNQKIK